MMCLIWDPGQCTDLQVAELPALETRSRSAAALSRTPIPPATTPTVINVAPCFDPEYPFKDVTHDRAEYYLRKGEAPGRWTGDGARALGLAGEVTPAALRALFCGKHPATGEYLASARGSSARANARAAGGTDLDVRAAAARLGVSADKVRALLRSGELAGEKRRSRTWRVSTDALDAYEQGRPQPQALGDLPAPAADNTYGLAEAARLVGVNRSYLARIAAEAPPEVTARPDGRPVPYLVGRRDDKGRWRVSAEELDRFSAGRVSARVVPAYDVAVRPPKSVSILHALAPLLDPATLRARGLPLDVAGEVLAAHHAAVGDVIATLERHAAFIRGPGGRVQAIGLTIAAFDHRSSRMGDPLLHTHLVVANVARGVDGRTAAVDGTALYAWAKATGHVYHARLRAELTRRLGVAFAEPHNGVADLLGVPRAVIDEFSQRSAQRDALLAACGCSSPAAAQAAVLASRPAKGAHPRQSPEQLARRAQRVGFSPADLVRHVLGRSRPAPVAAEELVEITERLAGPEGLCAQATCVDHRDALCGYAGALPGGAGRDDLERWSTRLLHDARRFLPVVPGRSASAGHIRRGDGALVRAGGVGPAFTTPELLDHEAALVAAHDEGRGAGLGLAGDDALSAALAGRPTLRAEQAAMVRAVCTSGHALEVVVGGPGTGKTFAIGAAADAWRASGYRVVGAALQGGAAEVLAAEAGLDEGSTLARLLGACQRYGAGLLVGAVVVVDEAGMADTRQLARLAAYAAEARAKLVLVGDPDQIPEVGAGGAFGHLVERCGEAVVALRENHRQRHEADRARLELLRDGRSAEVIASAKADGRWHGADSADEARAAALRAWHADPGVAGADKLLVATTVAEVERLNEAARALAMTDGRLGDEALVIGLSAPGRAVDERELRAGERVRATRNDYRLGVRTGQVGTVISVDPRRRRAAVCFDGRGSEPGPVATLDGTFLEERAVRTDDGRVEIRPPGLTHAYASTANATEGRTAGRAYVVVAAAGLYRQAIYVAASRAAEETHFYALVVPDLDELACPTRPDLALASDPDDPAALAEAMARDASQTMASVADPAAATVGQLLARPTAWLDAERAALAERLGSPPPLARSLRQVRTALATTYGLSLPSLECRPLDQAIEAALAVPGASVERLVELLLSRERFGTRELATARDPIAVLVWGAGTYAKEVLEAEAARRRAEDRRPADQRAAEAQAAQRLALVDTALSRQRTARLVVAEVDPNSPLARLLGPAPRTMAGLVAWRRAAAAILDYRDAVGAFDRPVVGDDPDAVLGPVPGDETLAAQRAEVERAVAAAVGAMNIAQVSRHTPPIGERPGPAVATLAGRSLVDLDAVLGAQRAKGVGARAKAGEVAEAIAVRERRLATTTVATPPLWVRVDVGERCGGRRIGDEEAARLALAYGTVAARLERSGNVSGPGHVAALVDAELARQPGLVRHDNRPGIGPEQPGPDLGLAR